MMKKVTKSFTDNYYGMKGNSCLYCTVGIFHWVYNSKFISVVNKHKGQ